MVTRALRRALEYSDALWLALLFLLALPALLPLFSSAPTRSADGLLHLYRLTQLDALWRQGIFFARWFPDVAYGYGLPLFNYYAPLAYYLTAPLHWLGAPSTLALNLSLAAALWLGAVGMFFFARALLESLDALARRGTEPRENFPELAALIAALAYLYAPYLGFNALQRANLAEQWALAFAPFALWRVLELTRRVTPLNWTLALLTFAALLLAHNVTGFLFAPLFLFFGAACALTQPKPFTPRVWAGIVSAFLGALALAAFFWLPALLERDYIQIARVIVTPDFDYRFNFVAPQALLALLPRADTGRLNPSYPDTLGLVQVILASAGLGVLGLKFRARRALPLCALALAAASFIFLMVAPSQPLWDNVTLLSFVQLPMRLRGLVALCLAPLTGIFLLALPPRARLGAASVALVILVLSAMPLLYPRYARATPLNPTLMDMFAYEQKTGAFGATSFGEYLPVWAQILPNQTPFAEAYERNANPNRFVIPEGVTLCGEQIAPLSQSLCTQAESAWHVVFRAFYFPGWRAYVNDAPVEIAPTPRTGLISFSAPPNASLRVEYQGTPVENLADGFSRASALVIFGVMIVAFARRRKTGNENENASRVRRPPQRAGLVTLTLVACGLLAFKIFYLDRTSNLFVARYDGETAQGIAQPRNLRFGDAFQFLGYDIGAAHARRGDTLRVTLYWRALPGLNRNLSTFVHLTAADGFVLAQQDNLHPANAPTARWDVDAYGADEHALEIPAALAPGTYTLRGGVYDPATNTRLRTADGADFVDLGRIEIK
jgi:hypothetical protein